MIEIAKKGITLRLRVIIGPVVSGLLVALFSSLAFSVIMGTSSGDVADATPPRDLAAVVKSLESILPTPVVAAAAPTNADGVGLVDVDTGIWHLRSRNGDPNTFFYGNPGDFPIMGDWDCDGIDTPGLYRQADGFVYLRNTKTQGPADILILLREPGGHSVCW